MTGRAIHPLARAELDLLAVAFALGLAFGFLVMAHRDLCRGRAQLRRQLAHVAVERDRLEDALAEAEQAMLRAARDLVEAEPIST